MATSFGILILAAGMSERMGTPKPLLPLGGKYFLEHILSNPFVAQNPVKPFIIVGHEKDKIRSVLPQEIPIIENTDYRTGRMSSIQAGLKVVPSSVEGVFVWPVDCPLVSEEVLNALTMPFQNKNNICIPSYRFRRGHPPLIGASYFSEILSMKADESLRELYARHPEAVVHVEVDTETVLHNVNTPEEYQALKKFWSDMESQHS